MLTVTAIIFIIVGFGIGYLTSSIKTKVKIAELEKSKAQLILDKKEMQEQWTKAVNELSQTKILLNDTLSALELLKQYRSIDDDTKKKINNLNQTLDPTGKPTDNTYDAFRKIIEEANKNNEEYNSTSLKITINDFVEIKEKAEKLFKEVTSMLIDSRTQ